MGLFKEIKDFFIISKLRFIGLRKEIKFLFLLSVFSILIIEFGLGFKTDNHFLNDIGKIWIKICYSYFSAFIFYYLVVYLPKERKRTSSYRYLNNKLLSINLIVNYIIITIFKEIDPTISNLINDIKEENIKEICKQINPNYSININLIEFSEFNNHYEFFNFQTNKIKLLISELLILNDILDENTLRSLTNLNDTITTSFSFDINIPPNQDMEYLSLGLYELYFESKEMVNNFTENYCLRYDYGYHKNERKRNQKKE
jgi:hypothetical protein